MFYACLATLLCLVTGITGIVLSFVDIERFNFGLYLALLSVVGATVSIAFWIISPTICANPRYGYKLDPIYEFTRRHFGQTRESRRKKMRERKNRGSGSFIETKIRRKKSKKALAFSEDSAAVTDKQNDNDERQQTSSSGYQSPNQTLVRPSHCDREASASVVTQITVDETFTTPRLSTASLIPALKKAKNSSLPHSKSVTICLDDQPPTARSSSRVDLLQ